MAFKMTLHSNPCFLSSPSHSKILWPTGGGLGRVNSTEVTLRDICLMALGGPITPSSWSVLPWSVLSPLNSWWPLVYKEGTSGSGVVTQESKWTGLKYPGSQWHLQERSQIRRSHARVLIPQICSVSPHPFLSSAICQRPREGWHPYQSRGWHGAQGQHWQNAHFFGWFTELITPPSALALSSSFLSNILSS